MTPEDRQAITAFFDRLRDASAEIDAEAEQLIRDEMERSPQARYHVTQLAFFQQQALAEAQNHIALLEHELAQRGNGGFLGGLFSNGGVNPALPEPVRAPGYRPGMFEQQGGFMGGAAATAMTSAGGLMLGAFLGSLFMPMPDMTTEVPEDDPFVEEPAMTSDEEW